MQVDSNTRAANGAIEGPVTSDPRSGHMRPPIPGFAAVMDAARGWFQNKVAAEVSVLTGRPFETVRKWMRGQVPDADVGLDLVVSRRGPEIIAIIAQRLPAERRAEFFEQLAKVAKRQALQARLAALKD